MKKLKTIYVLMVAVVISFGLLACKTNADDNGGSSGNSGTNYETPKAKLPESVGTNELAGKTFKYEDTYLTEVWKFSDTTIERVSDNSGITQTWNYRYTYDSEKELVYYSLISYKYQKYNDFGLEEEKTVDDINKVLSENYWTSEKSVEEANSAFKIVYTLKYELSDGGIRIQKRYFSGALPTNIEFTCWELSYLHGNSLSNFGIVSKSVPTTTLHFMSGGSYSNKQAFLDFEDGKFNGTVFESNKDYNGTNEEYFNLGTVEGTYETTATSKSQSITLTFTKIPETVTTVELNTKYTLTRAHYDTIEGMGLNLVTE